MPVKTVDLGKFEKSSKAKSLYEAVVVVSKRARQINDEIKIEMNKRLEPIKAKETEDDTINNQDKLNLSLEFEKRKKPSMDAIEQIIDSKVNFKYREEK